MNATTTLLTIATLCILTVVGFFMVVQRQLRRTLRAGGVR